jgi:hypothetical protein
MYGVLHGDGSLEELPAVTAALLDGDALLCFDSEGHVVARFTMADTMFGTIDELTRLAPMFKRLAEAAAELAELNNSP